MWPEGNPTGAPTQRILYWQVRSTCLLCVLFNVYIDYTQLVHLT